MTDKERKAERKAERKKIRRRAKRVEKLRLGNPQPEDKNLPVSFKEYSGLEKRAAKEIFYQLGTNRTLEKVFKILGINVSSLKTWSTEEKWVEWAESRQKEDEKLALQGKYSTQILSLNAKAKATLEEIVEKFAERLNTGVADIRASDAVNASKLLLGLADADKTPDILNTAVPIIIIVDRKEMDKKALEEKLAKDMAENPNIVIDGEGKPLEEKKPPQEVVN